MLLNYTCEPFKKEPYDKKIDLSKVEILTWKQSPDLFFINYIERYHNSTPGNVKSSDNSIYIKVINIKNYKEVVEYLTQNHSSKLKQWTK